MTQEAPQWTSERIKELRARLAITQAQLGLLAGASPLTAQQRVHQWERRSAPRDAIALLDQLDAIGLTADQRATLAMYGRPSDATFTALLKAFRIHLGLTPYGMAQLLGKPESYERTIIQLEAGRTPSGLERVAIINTIERVLANTDLMQAFNLEAAISLVQSPSLETEALFNLTPPAPTPPVEAPTPPTPPISVLAQARLYYANDEAATALLDGWSVTHAAWLAAASLADIHATIVAHKNAK